MTISTVGVVPGILRLAEEQSGNLAISLHAPNNAMRLQTMPITRKYPIEVVLDAVRTYVAHEPAGDLRVHPTRRVNISRSTRANWRPAGPLRQLCHVNLIGEPHRRRLPRPSGGLFPFPRSPARGRRGNSVRAERGADIAAACGQLSTRAAPGEVR
jgi:23S rRNA (adenine2503-C2)-methyltransferase